MTVGRKPGACSAGRPFGMRSGAALCAGHDVVMVWAPKSGAAGDRETRSRKGQSRTNAGCPRLRKLDIVVLMRIRSHDGSFEDSRPLAPRDRLVGALLLHA